MPRYDARSGRRSAPPTWPRSPASRGKPRVAACEDGVHGRPLFAGHASLPWPDEAHLILWHAQTLLREYRGDGHIAVLTAEGLSGVEALVTHAATNDIPSELLASSRAWPQPEWDAAIERLAARGLVDASANSPMPAANNVSASKTAPTRCRCLRTRASPTRTPNASSNSAARSVGW